jgi:hypothetical protein
VQGHGVRIDNGPISSIFIPIERVHAARRRRDPSPACARKGAACSSDCAMSIAGSRPISTAASG